MMFNKLIIILICKALLLHSLSVAQPIVILEYSDNSEAKKGSIIPSYKQPYYTKIKMLLSDQTLTLCMQKKTFIYHQLMK